MLNRCRVAVVHKPGEKRVEGKIEQDRSLLAIFQPVETMRMGAPVVSKN
jgi:hypothetical protein